MPGQGPIIPLFKPGYMLVPLGPLGSYGSFTHAPEPSQDPGYAPDTSGDAGPSTSPFAGNDDTDDDDDADQFIRADDSL